MYMYMNITVCVCVFFYFLHGYKIRQSKKLYLVDQILNLKNIYNLH